MLSVVITNTNNSFKLIMNVEYFLIYSTSLYKTNVYDIISRLQPIMFAVGPIVIF